MTKFSAALRSSLLLLALLPGVAAAQLGSLVVNVTSPGGGASVSGTVQVNASVTVIGLLTVSSVQFKLDGADLNGADGSAPYSTTWNTTGVANGTHTLTAVARDILGISWTSNPVTVTVNNAPPPDTTLPNVGISAPAGGATVSGTITISASASDNVGVAGVRFRVDGANVGSEDTSAPYAVSWNSAGVANGTHTLTAVARDAAGNTRTSPPVTVTVNNAPPPDTTPPSVSISAPAGGVTVSGTITVSATASDNTGVAGVRFLLDGVALGSEDASSPYGVSWNTAAAANGSHTLTAVARDAAGNSRTSAPVTVTVSNGTPPPQTQRFEETAPSVAVGAGWASDASRAWSGGTAAAATAAGAQATFSFNGTSAVWIGGRAPGTGIARVLVDGAFVAEVDTFSHTEEIRVAMYTVSGLAAGSHTLTIESTGRQNAAATGALVVVDAFDVPAPATSRLQETDPDVAYALVWSQGDPSRPFSGGTAALSSTAGARATLSFNGTAVTWIGARGPALGIARVSIDGGAPVMVDTYAATEQIQAALFTATGLAEGNHTLSVEVSGTKNAASGGTALVVDAFEVTAPGARVQETSAAITYASTWQVDNRDKAYAEGLAAESNVTGAQASFTFTGTGVRWVGARGPQTGIARVFLDGVAVGDIDCFSVTEGPQHTLFSATGLARGTHTLAIQVLGRNPLATNAWVLVDAFDVVP